ncbi:MAG: protein kinase domain-containing protein [Pseudonocardiaceae bacterium]
MIDEGELLAGRYRLVAQVGTGAMGVVWKAHDEHLNRVVAVKQLLHPGVDEAEVEEANRRARREARITARLNHPHAIVVYDMVEHERKPYLIMEYLRSESLSSVLAERGPLPPAEVARIGSQIASALAAAHEVGIVHRDVKPGNVLLAEDGTAKITDFGISRAAGDCTVTATGVLIGTPAYLAPEVARGQQADFPADVFALGATLYAAVEGTPPFGVDDNPLALLYRIVNHEIIPPTRSGPLTDVLSRLLDCELSRRPTMRQARDALAAAPTTSLDLAAAGISGTPDDPSSPASGSSTTGSFATPSLPVDASAPTVKVGLIGPGTTPWTPAEGDKRPRHPAAVLTVVASLLVVGFMLVAALINHRSDTAGPPPGTSSTTPGAGQNKPAPQNPPGEDDDAGVAPVLATIPAPASVSSPEPSLVPPSDPRAAPPPGPSGVPSSGSSTTPSPEPSLEDERVSNPDPSQVPDPELGPVPSPEPSPDPSPEPENNPEPSPPSDASGR